MGLDAVRLQPARKGENGFSVAELVVAVAILFVVTVSIMGTLSFASTSDVQTTRRQGAVDLANAKIEAARNLAYDDVGTVGGNPAGVIPSPETVGPYTVTTVVTYAFDSSGDATYKLIRVTVSWTTPASGSIVMDSAIYGSSTAVLNNATLKVTVLDALNSNAPISGADVFVDPSLGDLMDVPTGSDGVATFGYVPSGYTGVDVQLDGWVFDTAQFESIMVTPATPAQITVNGYRDSTQGFLVTNGSNGPALPNANVTITEWNSGVSGATQQDQTDSSGLASFSGLFPSTVRTYTYSVDCTGYVSATGSFSIPTAGAANANIVVPLNPVGAVAITVLDSKTGSALSNATVNLMPGSKTATTPASGLVVFTTGPVLSKPATVTVGRSGYATQSVTWTYVGPYAHTFSLVANGYGSLLVQVRRRWDGSGRAGQPFMVTGPGFVTPRYFLTDSSGNYTITNLPAGGVYTVSIMKRKRRNNGTPPYTPMPSQVANSSPIVSNGTVSLTFTF